MEVIVINMGIIGGGRRVHEQEEICNDGIF